MNFNQLVAITAPEYGRQPEGRVCPDQYVGPLSQVISQPDFPFRTAVTARTPSPCLIMVLESPHIDEFVGDPGPAKGKTGKLLRLHLGVAIDCTRLQDMGLILVNPIQHQCSLGDIDLYRDKMFRAVWANGGQEDFKHRLLATYKSGDMLMNCCTTGKDYDFHTPLRNLVETALREALPNVQSVKRTHPASWRWPENRGRKWSY